MSSQAFISNATATTLAAVGDGYSVPRMPTAQRLAIVFTARDQGMMVYDTTLNNLFIWTGAAWESVPASGDAGADGSVQYNDNGVVSGAANLQYNKASGFTSLRSGSALRAYVADNSVYSTIKDNGAAGGLTIDNLNADGISLRIASTDVLNVSAGIATITGALTVDTSTLKVDATNHRVGIGTATPDSLLQMAGAGTINWKLSNTSDSVTVGCYAGTNAATTGTLSNHPFFLYTNNTERYRLASDGICTWSNVGGVAGTAMTLNSTGLGVGGSPLDKFTVVGNSFLRGAAAGVRIGDGGGYGFISAYDQTLSTAKDLVLQTGGGNVGVGGAPSAWRNTQRALQIGAVGSYFSSAASTGSTCIGRNVYESSAGNFTYIVNDEATLYEQSATGVHAWYNAAAGTGNITFTQAMTLDASGNLLVGTTSTAGSVSNTTKTVGGVFSSINGTTASTASGSAVTLFAAPTESSYLLSAYLFGAGSASAYHVVAIVKVNGGNVAITAISSATGISISSSGLNIQATQTSGISQAVSWNVVRLS